MASLQSQLHTLTTSLESYKHQLSTWQSSYHEEVSTRQDVQSQLDQQTLALRTLESDLAYWRPIAQREQDSARNLQQVLEEFQAEQDSQLDAAVSSLQAQYDETAAKLTEAQERAQTLEAQYKDLQDASNRVTHLEQQTKEKNLLIGKLRHEAVILNEHLTEALRRLQKDSSDVNVDRRLVSNVLLQFLTTPRQDAKRFEMLNLIGQVLQWGEEERQVAGLSKGMGESPRRGKAVNTNDGIGQEEVSLEVRYPVVGFLDDVLTLKLRQSFSNAFVEFLLSEASQSQTQTQSQASTPTPQSPSSPPSNHMRNMSIASSRRPK